MVIAYLAPMLVLFVLNAQVQLPARSVKQVMLFLHAEPALQGITHQPHYLHWFAPLALQL